MLHPDARRALLTIARDSVQAAARGAEPGEPPPENPALHVPGAAFVTLRAGGELRGCIGHVAAEQPLWISVREMAAASATRDDRFTPVTPDEVAGLTIELSLLSPRRRIAGPEEVLIGRDGIHIRNGVHSGLLLPQVAVEHGWTAGDFLAHTCRKAGLPADAWTDPETLIQVFTAEAFNDAGDHS